MKRYIVLLGGKIKSGKDFTSDLLVNNANWQKIPFATGLKEITSKKFNIPLEDLYSQEGKMKLFDNERTYRDLLIETADLYKKQDLNFFVRDVITKINKTQKNTVISDFRHPHEYQAIVDYFLDTCIIKTGLVVRDSQVTLNTLSELSLTRFNFDFVLYNNKDEKDVYEDLCYHILNENKSTET